MVSKSRSPRLMALFFALCLCVFVAQSHAQFLGYTSPQTVGPITCISAAVAATTSSSTPGAASFIPALGQSVHYLTYTTSGPITTLSVQLDGSFNNTTWFRVSETASSPGSGAVSANVYYPFIRCNLTTVTGGGSVTAVYTGTSVSAGPPAGIFNSSGVFTKVLATDAAGNALTTYDIELPFGQSGGVLYFQMSGAGYAGARLTIEAGPDFTRLGTILPIINPYLLQGQSGLGTTEMQIIEVPATPANVVRVSYGTGAATTLTYFLAYSFKTGASSSTDITLGPENGIRMYACNRQANINISASGLRQIIAGGTNQVIRVCHISVSFNGVTDFSIATGTGANCSTGTVSQTGVYQDITAITLDFSSLAPLQIIRSQALCTNTVSAVTGGGVIIYAQF